MAGTCCYTKKAYCPTLYHVDFGLTFSGLFAFVDDTVCERDIGLIVWMALYWKKDIC